jgi:3-deoxy-D-manno-octulosonic-acid transferase
MRFWRYWQPAKLVLIESEVWPNLLAVAQRFHTPVYLVNARFSPRSQRRWLWFGPLARWIFTKINHATAPHNQTADFLRHVGVQRVTCLPHLKYAAEPLPYDDAQHAFYTQALKGRPTWVAASIHPGEDTHVIKAHQLIQKACPTALTFLVPRHPHRCPEIEKKLKEAGITWVRHTQAHNLDGVEMVLVDTLGELGLFYALSHVSFVGGSLAPHIGGHNPIEPALYAHALTWGPYVHNFTDICQDLQPAAQVVTGAQTLADIIIQWLQNPEQAHEHGQAALRIAQHKRSGLDALINVIMA